MTTTTRGTMMMGRAWENALWDVDGRNSMC